MRQTRVAEIADRLAFQIASGGYQPGDKLPSVRQLARDHDINPSTVQVVLARLQEAGFVETHRGIGFLVQDIRLYGGIESWRYIFRFSSRLPDVATKIFEDILDALLILMRETAIRIQQEPRRYDPSPVRRAVDQFDLLTAAEPRDHAALAKAELHAFRAMAASVGQTVHLALLNSIGDMITEVDEVRDALMPEPELHLSIWRGLLTAWEQGTIEPSALKVIEATIKAYNVKIIQRYRDSITT